MSSSNLTCRNVLLGTGAAVAALAASSRASSQAVATPKDYTPTADQLRRMQWWHAAKFGMFIHFGLYSQNARHEWAMEDEAIPVLDYQKLAGEFRPLPGAPKAWAKLAKAAGMKYMVMTTKHHEGFCHFD